MIVVDSSVWVELLRGTHSPAHLRLRGLIESGAELAVTEMVLAETLAGARRDQALATRRRLLAFPVLPLRGVRDYEAAAALYRVCHEAGETIRSIADCLIAVPTIRARATLLHADRDFEKLARHTPLEVLPV